MSKRRNKGSLRGRLERLGIAKERPAAPAVLPGPTDMRKRLRRLYSVGDDKLELTLPAGIKFEPEAEDVDLQLEHDHPADMSHGSMRLDELFEAARLGSAERLAEDPTFADFDPRRALYFDTETTGLAGGAGTLVFLVGWGYFEDERFVVRQGLVQDFGKEVEVLEEFSKAAVQYDTLVSFNGRAFDIDRLKLRYAMNRMVFEARTMPHLDLLYPARRILGPALMDVGCNLKSLEVRYLGFSREGDIDGAAAPGIYLEWLNHRRNAKMAQVIEHNRLDILTLVTLTTLLLRRASAPAESARSGAEHFAAARFLLRSGDEDERAAAVTSFEQALDAPLTPPMRIRAKRELASLYKRQRRWAEAVELWAALAERDPEPWVLAELAKAYEHRLGDLQRAERWAERLVAVVKPSARPAALSRLERIRKKLG